MKIHSEYDDERKYNSSTFFLAQGVLRKNFKLDLMLGSCVKQRTGTTAAIASQPMFSESWVIIISRVMPSRLRVCVGVLLAFMVCSLRGMFDCWIPAYAGRTKQILQGIADSNMGASKNSEFAQMQGARKILVPANLKVTLH